MLAAAFDERIAVAIPHQAGCGGSAPSRARIAIGKPYNTLDTPQTKPPETVADINDKFPHWFNARFKEFNAQPERLPFDQHCLVALCAPRPVLFTNGRADTWINPAGQFEVLRGAAPVYRLLGAGDFTAEELPPDGRSDTTACSVTFSAPAATRLLREDWKCFSILRTSSLARSGAMSGVRRSGSATGPIVIDQEYPHSFPLRERRTVFPDGRHGVFPHADAQRM